MKKLTTTRILEAVKKSEKGMTSFELADALGIKKQSITPRLPILVRMGLLTRTNEQRSKGRHGGYVYVASNGKTKLKLRHNADTVSRLVSLMLLVPTVTEHQAARIMGERPEVLFSIWMEAKKFIREEKHE